jgi:oligoendopeptidase F
MKNLTNDNELQKQVWDLSRLEKEFGSFKEYQKKSKKFLNQLLKVKEKFPNLEKPELLKFFKQLDSLYTLQETVDVFAYLKVAQNCLDEDVSKFESAVSDWTSLIESELVFIDNKILKANKQVVKMLTNDPDFAFCAFYVKEIIANKEHYLSTEQEMLLSELYPSALLSWKKSFENSISKLEVQYSKTKKYSLDTVLGMLFSPKVEVRKKASEAIGQTLDEELSHRANAYENVIKHHSVEDKYRKFSRWDHSSAASNSIGLKTIDVVMKEISGRIDLCHDWHKFLASKMGEEKLSWHNRVAPVVEYKEEYVSFSEAKEIIIEAFNAVDEEFGINIKDFLDSNSIHAVSSKGKTTGAFCAGVVSQKFPYILLNWSGTTDDILALAHECGHAIHAIYSDGISSFHFDPPLVLAETASVFSEMVVFDYLIEKAKNPKLKARILAKNITDQIITIFRQASYYQFEAEVHEYRKSIGEINASNLGEIWLKHTKEYYGKNVDVPDYSSNHWSYVPHFMSVGYVFSYSFGQLLTIALYGQYKKAKAENKESEFLTKYKSMLKSAGSDWPKEIAQIANIDIESKKVWADGLKTLEKMIESAKETINSVT